MRRGSKVPKRGVISRSVRVLRNQASLVRDHAGAGGEARKGPKGAQKSVYPTLDIHLFHLNPPERGERGGGQLH